MVERGRKIILICMAIVLASVLNGFLTSARLMSPLLGLLIFGVLFYFTYRGKDLARMSLFVMLLLSGLAGSYAGVKIYLEHHSLAGVLIFIMNLLDVFVGFVLVLNRSVNAVIHSGRKR